jgi:hypothetical protein
MKALHLMAALALLAAVACNKTKDTPAADSQSGMPMDSGGMAGMKGMENSSMMPMMQAHTDSMMRLTPGQMSGLMASHERMMSQMMDQMGADMRQMKMADTPQWSALTDSVKQDLAELPGLKGQALSTRMKGHADRVRRLIAAHKEMMNRMR